MVKSDAEVQLMRENSVLTAEAFKSVIRSSRPGVSELELEGLFTYETAKRGARRLAYPPVVAGGERATVLHYIANDQIVRYVLAASA